MTSLSASSKPTLDVNKEFDRLAPLVKQSQAEITSIILGQDSVIELALTSLLSGGHFILVGVPGLAKTKLVHTIGTVMGLDAHRIQCTPDLMPADIVGSEILDEDSKGKKEFRFIEGPVFTQLLMADEINRASPRTQSALLEAMQERQVTVAGQTRKLPTPFHVMATQNPIEQEGTYPLPEAQLDRFLMQIHVSYPDATSERAMLIQTTSTSEKQAVGVMSAKDVLAAQELVRAMPVGDALVDQIMSILKMARPETSDNKTVKDYLQWGPGPRAGQAFMMAVRAHALLQGRSAPLLEDCLAVAPSILRHRIGLAYSARANGIDETYVIDEICRQLS